MTATNPTLIPDALPVPRTPRARSYRQTGIARLTVIELRKFFATRAGIGLAIGVCVLLGTVAAVASFTGPAADHTFAQVLQIVVFNSAILMPVLSVMVFTSEWSTRATLTTFALTPQRWRIVTAKALASITLGLAGFVVASLASTIGVLAATSSAADPWNMTAGLFAQTGLWMVISSLGGAALASVILSTPAAIVAIFMLPSLVALLGMWSRVEDALGWISQDATMARLAEHTLTTGTDWAHVAAGIGVWIALPFILGIRRILRSDIS